MTQINVPELPDISLLERMCHDIEEIWNPDSQRQYDSYKGGSVITNWYTGGKPKVRFSESDMKLKEELSRALTKLARPYAEEIVYRTIDTLARFFGLSDEYKENLPFVELIDFTEQYYRKTEEENCLAEPCSYLYPFPNGSSFTFRGYNDFGQPAGPVVTLLESDFDLSAVLEESVHFLQAFYELGEFERKLRIGCYDVPSEEWAHGKKLVFSRIKDSQILLGKYGDSDMSETIAHGVTNEAIAFFTRIKFDVEQDKSDYEILESSQGLEILGIPEGRNPYDLLESLIRGGRIACFKKLLDWNDCLSFDQLKNSYVFRNLLTNNFPRQLNHYLGYNLGIVLARAVQTDERLKYLGGIAFKHGLDSEEKLDLLLNLAA